MKKNKQPFDNQIAIYQSPDGLVNVKREPDEHSVGAEFAHTDEDFSAVQAVTCKKLLQVQKLQV